MYFDGSLKLEGVGAGVLLISPIAEQLKYVLQIFWKVSNNEAEYEALLHGLRLAASLGIKRLLVYRDSTMVINQVNKSWDRNKENIAAYCLQVHKVENKFYGLEFHHVVRDNNVAADVLSKLGSTRAQVPAGVFVHELHAPSIPELAPTTTDPAPLPAGREVMMIDVDWRQPFINYIREQKVPADKNSAEQLIRQAKSYVLVGDMLYRRAATSGVLMKCVPREEGKDILEEIHKGVCGNHASSRTLVSKAFRRAFYWSTALGDAYELVSRCQGCEYFAKQQHVPAYKLFTIPPTWPFACWGLDMIRPLPTASGGFNRVLVAIYKFTKWIEVKPVTGPKAGRVLDFLDELMHRYGSPHPIIADLGSNFNNHQFWEYCENNEIDVRYVFVAHPRANGQVERANGMVLDALKKRLHNAANTKGGKWIKELPNALWGLRTQPTKPTGQPPYFLAYGSEAILHVDVMWDSPAVEQYDAEELVSRCQGCQYFAKQQHVPAYKLVTIPPTWPFACWGLDMIRPLPTASEGFNRVLVAIDKFTKWIEVKPVTCPKADRVLNFLDELVHRYRLPHRIIADLGSNFNNHQFWEYCENSGIDVRYVSVAHPRANGQVERANGMVLDALKKRLHDAANTKGGKWIKELPNALWGLRTQPTKPTGQSPYFLVYGSEAILPADVMWDSPAVEQYDEGISEDSRRDDIDGLEEACCAALDQSARYLEGIRCYHDRNVKERSFNIGDLVLRHIQNTEGLRKLSSPWEGPFTVARVTGPGSYHLQTLEGEDISNS
jgi:ribonuclease HI